VAWARKMFTTNTITNAGNTASINSRTQAPRVPLAVAFGVSTLASGKFDSSFIVGLDSRNCERQPRQAEHHPRGKALYKGRYQRA